MLNEGTKRNVPAKGSCGTPNYYYYYYYYYDYDYDYDYDYYYYYYYYCFYYYYYFSALVSQWTTWRARPWSRIAAGTGDLAGWWWL